MVESEFPRCPVPRGSGVCVCGMAESRRCGAGYECFGWSHTATDHTDLLIVAIRPMNLWIVCLIALFSSTTGFNTARPELGEWVVRHSTHRRAPPDNRAVVHVYPGNKVVVGHRFSRGPFVFSRQLNGQYFLSSGSDEKKTVTCTFYEKQEQIISLYGVGLRDVTRMIRKPTVMEYKFFFMMHGVQDMFLTAVVDSEGEEDTTFYCHLVRCVRVDEPNIDVPFSTFVFTQVLGVLLSSLIHMNWQ